mmetsp:Transcript_20369/g.33596  ORF Transcript_20369/g.33596 Transcript_20369/m.33596 type:complete len:86 (-) Transcript_20369:257-514(-)
MHKWQFWSCVYVHCLLPRGIVHVFHGQDIQLYATTKNVLLSELRCTQLGRDQVGAKSYLTRFYAAINTLVDSQQGKGPQQGKGLR